MGYTLLYTYRQKIYIYRVPPNEYKKLLGMFHILLSLYNVTHPIYIWKKGCINTQLDESENFLLNNLWM